MNRKIVSLLVVLSLALPALACGLSGAEKATEPAPTQKSETVIEIEEPTLTPEPTEAPPPSPTPMPEPEEEPAVAEDESAPADEADQPQDVAVDEGELDLDGEIRQWASSASASSEYGSDKWSASQATGAPDTPGCGDSVTAWAAASLDTVEWLELGYDVPVFASQVNVIQSNTPDQVSTVELLDIDGEYHTIYSGTPEGLVECPYTLSIPVEGADYRAAGVRVTSDQSVIPAPWNEIDAVELVGFASPEAMLAAATAVPEPTDTPEQAPPEPVWTSYTQYSTDGGLAKDDVMGVAVTADGTAWFGTDGYGLSSFDGQTWTTYTTEDGLADDTVKSLAVGQDGSLWIGTFGYGISQLTDPGGEQTWIGHGPQDGLPGDNVFSLYTAPDGSVWAGTQSGVGHFDGQNWTGYTTADGLAHNVVRVVTVTPDGTVWAGTDRGVSSFDGKTWTSYGTADGLAHDQVHSAVEGPDKAMWFGTLDGVSRFDGQDWTTYKPEEGGLADRKVFAIVVQDDGVMWFGTNWGLSRFTGLADNVDGEELWHTFGGWDDELLDNTIKAMALAPDGTLWVTTPTGVSHYALVE